MRSSPPTLLARFLFTLALGLGLIVATPKVHARALTLDEAVTLALSHSRAIQKAQAQVAELDATRKSTRGAFLPTLKVNANVFVWDSELPFDLGDLGKILANFIPPGTPAMSFGNIRDQVTSTISVTLAQPLTPLWQISKGYSAIKHGKRAAQEMVKKSRVDVAADTRKAYIQLKQAQAGVKIAQSAVAQVQAQLKVAKAFFDAGVLEKKEVLKAEVGLARARGALVQTRAGFQLAQAALALKLGLGPDDPIDARERFGEPSPQTKTFGQYLQEALTQRPMLAAVKAQQASAHAQTSAAKGALIPTIVALATYQHSEGQGFIMPKNAFFAGGTLSWSFDWGKDYYKLAAAKSKVRQTELDEKRLKDGIFLQVKQAFLALQTARQQLVIARAAITQAQEAFRIEESKFKQASATTTDVLNAQLALNSARLTEINALFGFHIARSELARATAAPFHAAATSSRPSTGTKR